MHPFELIPGIHVIRPKERALIERFGKYQKFAEPGFHFIIPFVDSLYRVNVSEQSKNISPSGMITKDNLNVDVDLEVYYQVKKTEEAVKRSQYNADDYQRQIVSLSQTGARNVIGTKTFEEVNSKRSELNGELRAELDKETEKWGIEVVRVEMEEITPPQDVQESMNRIIKAENEKDAAKDFAEAEETKADGERRAEIKRAQGKKEAAVLEAEGDAESIQKVADARAEEIEIVNQALQQHFQGPAVEYKKLETVVDSLDRNSKYILDTDKDLTTVLSEVGGITPINDSDKEDDMTPTDMDIDLEAAAKKQAEAEQVDA